MAWSYSSLVVKHSDLSIPTFQLPSRKINMERVLNESQLEKECGQGMWLCGTRLLSVYKTPPSNPGTKTNKQTNRMQSATTI